MAFETVGVTIVFAAVLVGVALSNVLIETVAVDPSERSISKVNTQKQLQSDKYLLADKDIALCHQSDTDLGECLKRVINTIIPRLKAGNKALHIPAYDPFVLNKTTIQYKSDLVSGRITIKNTTVNGIVNAKVRSINLKMRDNDKLQIRLLQHLPKVTINGAYKGEFFVNRLQSQIKPKGRFNITLSNVNIDFVGDGEFYTKEGHQFVHLESFDLKPHADDMTFDATGIFPDPSLNEMALTVMKQYWREIVNVVLPETRHFWGPLLISIANEICSVIPFDEYVQS